MFLRIVFVALACVAVVNIGAADDAVAHRSGQVTTADGKPIAGATVRVIDAMASVKEDQICPSVFPGVGKTYTTDAEGKYELEAVHPRLKYQVAISAAGYKPHVIAEMSGWVSKPLVNKLQPVTANPEAADTVSGHVLDDNGKPLAGAVIEFFAETKGNGNNRSTQFGGLSGVDHFAVSDADGVFVCEAKGGHRKFFTKVQASGFAPQIIQMEAGTDAPDGNDVHLSHGCTVTGRLVKDGQPVAGVKMMLSQQDLNSEQHVGFFSIGTDAEGKFTFEHLPETEDCQVWAAFASLGSRGATEAVKVRTGATAGNVADTGDITVGPAVTISGTCVLPEGVKSFKGVTLWVSPKDHDGASVNIAEDGSFKVTGMPVGSITMRLSGGGLVLSPDNASYFAGNREMLGKVEGDTTLKLKLAKQSDVAQDGGGFSGNEYEAKKGEPLQGVSEEEKK